MIKFPTVHIATSVVNRIKAVADGLPDRAGQAREAPEMPNTSHQSATLDAALMQPVAANLGPLEGAPDPGATAGGKPLLDTMLEPSQG